nr:hypothetical protein [uncultured Dysosmobacter sp.]
MLRKLLKHEFRATARIMVPVYLVLLVTALGANFSTRGILETPYAVLNILGSLLVMAFVVAIMAVCVVSFLLMIQRFYKNLLRDEGYLMLTLPASIHQQVWSKLIVSSVWFIITGVVVMLSFVMMALDVSFLEEMVQVLQQLFQDITAYYAINGTVLLLELLVLAFAGCIAFCLQFYAALAIGHSFSNHKFAWSVAFFFILQFASKLVGSLLLLSLNTSLINSLLGSLDFRVSGMTAIHIGMGNLIAVCVVYSAVFYVITTYFLKKHLNLE